MNIDQTDPKDTIIRVNHDCSAYFKHFMSAPLEGRHVLDFGCGTGQLLAGWGPDLMAEQYTGIDVRKHLLRLNQERMPLATWVHSNRHNLAHNPKGNRIHPLLARNYDLIVAYSVFSHMEGPDIQETIDWMYSRLNCGGTIAVSYCDLDNSRCVEHFRQERIRQFGHCDNFGPEEHGQGYAYLYDQLSYQPYSTFTHFVAFYRRTTLAELLKPYAPEFHPAPGKWPQDLMIIRRPYPSTNELI